MLTETIVLRSASPGQQHRLTVLRFGTPGAGPKATIQAALHADEVPAMLVAQQLRRHLTELEAAGALRGEVVLVPYANPLGLAQRVLGQDQGRFDLHDGMNFNRGFPALAEAAAERLRGRLGSDADTNRRLIREALSQAAHAGDMASACQPAQDLKRQLLRLAVDSDIVLDLHCDAQAVMHLYTLTPHAQQGAELAALLGAQALLLADDSGDHPFDEACSRPWLQLAQRFAPLPVPLSCFAATVELRGEADTRHDWAAQDAQALIEFLRRHGVVAGTPAPLPVARCQATPLAASEPITAPEAGVVVFHVEPGTAVKPGTVIADIVDADSGKVTPVRAQSAGLLYARCTTRWATPGRRLAKIAGTTLVRTGKLLSP
jgi:uncharacterized protein